MQNKNGRFKATWPLVSMTGLGRAQMSAGAHSVEVIARSVNFRGLDCRCRLPNDLLVMEPIIHRMVGAKFNRGRIDIDVKQHVLSTQATSIVINKEAFVQVMTELGKIRDQFSDLPITMGDVLRIPGVVYANENKPDQPLEEIAEIAVKTVLDDLAKSRSHEGELLQNALKEMLEHAADAIAAIDARAKDDNHARFDKFKDRVHDLVRQFGMDQNRMMQEFALLVERADFKEEIDRLHAHILHFESLCLDGQAVGRKLDFLCQEMLRETNTLLSKAFDGDVTIKAIDLKANIERMREQVQNIE